MNREQGNLAATPLIAEAKSERKFDPERFEVANTLQTTLSVDELLALFNNRIKSFVKQTGLLFTNESLKIEHKLGQRAAHSCSYNLVLENEPLGTLTLMRRKKFEEAETELIEALIGCLIYPLRNGLLYLKALQSAQTDPLTGLNNRFAFDKSLQHEWSLSRRHDSPFSILILDIDHFKQINDQKGHAAGDAALVAVANAIQETIRDSDTAYRFGGEEFVILLNNTTEPGSSLLGNRIRKKIESLRIKYEREEITLTASLGSATLSRSETGEQLLNRADSALYEAKETGRNRVVSAG